ncbi:MAG TPA: hypothetical protein VI306_19625 [Pyrinomonadaceae bacterium]
MFKFTLKVLTIGMFVCAFCMVAQAQATRTWVSGVGDDVNPCSRTAPCKTFAGAISKTFINGEINCLDPGGYGTVTITKSITIDCEDTQGSILASGTNGINVSLGAANANDPLRTVRLRGLSINGAGASGTVGTATGLNGISVNTSNTAGVKVFVEECIIQNFTTTGILFTPSANSDLVVNDTEIINVGFNVAPLTQSGIRADSGNGTAHLDVTVDNTHCDLNLQGIRFEDNVSGHIRNSTASNNILNGFVVFPTTQSSSMTIDNSSAASNHQFGVFAGGSGAIIGTLRLSGVTAVDNTTSQVQTQAPGVACTNSHNHIGTPSAGTLSNCYADQ